MKITNGNKKTRRKGIKFLAWNHGNSELQNSFNEIEILVDEHQPDVFGIYESNLKKGYDPRLVNIKGYELHTAPTLNNSDLSISRVVVFTRNNITVKRRTDLEDSSLSAIWLELGLPRQRKIIVANIYREWKFMGQENNDSASIPAQLERWKMFINKWESALNEGKETLAIREQSRFNMTLEKCKKLARLGQQRAPIKTDR